MNAAFIAMFSAHGNRYIYRGSTVRNERRICVRQLRRLGKIHSGHYMYIHSGHYMYITYINTVHLV